MNRLKKISSKLALLCTFTALVLTGPSLSAAENAVKTGVVNFKKCIEESQLGSKEQETLQSMKEEFENSLSDKEKKLSEMSGKFNDDYLDSISQDQEKQLRDEFTELSQEFAQLQNQYYQLLQQAHMRMIQQVGQVVVDASEKVAKKEGYDIVLNQEAVFYFSDAIDLTDEVIEYMNKMN